MAEIAMDMVLSTVANRLSKILIEEYAVLGGGAVRHVEWIEKELRLMQGLLEQVGQSTYGEQEQDLREWEEKLKEVARDAEDVIETFVIKSVKRRRWGVLYWYDKHKVVKELMHIRKRMRDISQTRMNLSTNVGVSVETPGEEASSSSSSSTTLSLTNTAIEKLDHILSQNLIMNVEVIEMVEEVKDDLGYLQNIVSNLSSSSEKVTVWLEEVKEVCDYTADATGNFISRRKWFKNRKFKKQMKHVSAKIGDVLHKYLTYEVGGQLVDMGVGNMNERTRSRTVPVQDLLVENLIISQIPFLVYYVVVLFVRSARVLPTSFFFLIVLDLFKIAGKQGRRIRKSKPNFILNQKKGSRERMEKVVRVFGFFTLYPLIYILILMLSQILGFPIQATFLLSLSQSLYEVIAWTVSLRKSMENNLMSTERYLVLMHMLFSDAEGLVLNERQRVWMGQLRVVYQKGQSLIGAAYPKGKCDCLSRTKYAKYINGLLKEILVISDRKVMYGIANIIIQGTPARALASSSSSSSSYHPVTGLKEEVQSIIGEKQLMDALLADAQKLGELDGSSRRWVEQLRGISLEAESVISKYNVKLKDKPIFIHIFKYWTRYVISNKIDDVKDKIEDAYRRKREYGFVQIQSRAELSSSTVQILRGRTKPLLVAKESSVVGFDDDAQVLMAQLMSEEKHRCITWIVGIKGIGKRTLAKLIFQDSAVVDYFDCRLWVSLSTSNSNLTAPQLLEEISIEAKKQINRDSSSEPVLETLARSKYLIVIDGIEEKYQEYLDTLKDAIPDMSTSSRLLLTTCNATRQVAGTITFVYPLQLLDDESSWVMFKRHLKVDISEDEPKIIKFGRDFVMKCGGLPSQISKMTVLLANQDVTLTQEAWSSVLGGHQFKQDQIQSWSRTLDTINTNLPSYLRRCLFYFMLFPAEFGIPVRRLIVLWAAEGLVIHRSEEVPAELVAKRYLTELIDRNMVQVAKRKRNGEVKTCRLPSALRQLWLTKGNKSKVLRQRTANTTTTDSNVETKKSIIRRVADNLDEDDIWNDHIHSGSTDSTTLRTNYKDVLSFLSFDTQEGSKPGQQVGNFLNGCISSDCFLLLRVLDLERVYKPKLPKRIKRLTRLRYLGLRWTYLESLPSSISKLLKLQTLDLKHTYIHTLPTSIWKMELRHLFLSETYRTKFPPQPKGNSLSDLQTFWGLFVDEETPVKDGLDRLVNITKLGLACQSMSLNQEAMIAQLETVADWIKKLEHLQSLRLKSRDEEGLPWILHLNSFENNVNLTDMYLLGSLSSSSVCLSQFPRSLIDLTLSHSKLEADPMKLLKDFPNLQTLCLLAESYTGTTMVCESQSFPQLHVLKIWVLEQLEEWKIEHGALPCLRQLEIRSCRNLQRLPDGLKHVNTLLELKLTNMPKEINAEADNIPPSCQVDRKDFQ